MSGPPVRLAAQDHSSLQAAGGLVLVVAAGLLVLALYWARWLTILCLLLLLAGIVLMCQLIAYPAGPGAWPWNALDWLGMGPEG